MFYTPINVFNIKIKRSIDALYKGQLQKKIQSFQIHHE